MSFVDHTCPQTKRWVSASLLPYRVESLIGSPCKSGAKPIMEDYESHCKKSELSYCPQRDGVCNPVLNVLTIAQLKLDVRRV